MSSDEDLNQDSPLTRRSESETPPSVPANERRTPPARRPSAFLFVNANERTATGRHNEGSRTLVRSHVMNNFYWKKSLPQDGVDELSKDTKPGQPRGQKSKLRMESCPQKRKGRRRREKPNDVPAKGKGESLESVMGNQGLIGAPLDPFSMAALPWDSDMQGLVQYYAAEIPIRIHPFKYPMYLVQNAILKMAITDEALLHAILAYSLIHKYSFATSSQPTDLERIRFAITNPDFLRHRTRAMHLINAKIGAGDVCDATIATVLILLWHHPWTQGAGDQEALIHFTGLMHMVKCRGGLELLPVALSNSIAFHDTKRSMLNCSVPKLPVKRKLPSHKLPSHVSELAVPVRNAESVFFQAPILFRQFLDSDLWDILFSLNQLTDFVSYYRSRERDFGSAQSVLFEHWNTSLEHRILSYSSSDLGTNLSNDNFKEALRTAAALWMTTGLWNFPLSASLVTSMSAHLVRILENSDLWLWWEQFPDVLLWVLVIGACCTPFEGTRRSFLLSPLRFIANERKFDGAGSLAKPLWRFIYMDGAYSAPLGRLWDDIVRKVHT